MSDHLDSKFIEEQRQRLEDLQARIISGRGQREADRQARDSQARDVQDSGEQGATEAQRSRREALDANARLSLSDVRRALEKIEEGSYGLSDESGEPIPRGRLEAIPQANLTVEEESERERRARIQGD